MAVSLAHAVHTWLEHWSCIRVTLGLITMQPDGAGIFFSYMPWFNTCRGLHSICKNDLDFCECCIHDRSRFWYCFKRETLHRSRKTNFLSVKL